LFEEDNENETIGKISNNGTQECLFVRHRCKVMAMG
jgi:hypothetical protein